MNFFMSILKKQNLMIAGRGGFTPFDTFAEIHFWLTDPKIFLKAPLATLRGSARQKKTPFFVKIFQKGPKNGFFDCFFFKNLPAVQKI